jgi:prenylcysteine oxidase/farnesylcysteine lyase
MIKASSAKLKTNQKVTKISKNKQNGKWTVTTAESSNTYDAVILATPPHHSNIALISKNLNIYIRHSKRSFSDIRDEITKVDYVQQHVTLFTTNATHLGSSYMKMAIPISILVTRYRERQNMTNDLNLDVEAMSFSKVLYPRKERLVKLFSPIYLDDSKLAKIVGGRANVGWVYRKMWYAYPRAPPRNDTIFPPVNPDEGLYYANAFESFISTMETQCLAAHNIVRLLLADYGYDEKAATQADDYWIDTTN